MVGVYYPALGWFAANYDDDGRLSFDYGMPSNRKADDAFDRLDSYFLKL